MHVSSPAELELQAHRSFLRKNARDFLSDSSYIDCVVFGQSTMVKLKRDLDEKYPNEELSPADETNTVAADVWASFARLLRAVGKCHQAVEVLDALYDRMLLYQCQTQKRCHKGMPLFEISHCFQRMGLAVHAKRYMMLTLCEDAVTGKGTLNLQTTWSLGGLAWGYGTPEEKISEYSKTVYEKFVGDPVSGRLPDWLLQELDQDWKTEVPSPQEAGIFRVNRAYCELLMGRLGGGDGKDLERLAEYLEGAMPGCRTYRRQQTHSTDYDVIASVEGPVTDFRSELGRYLVCECKDKSTDPLSFTEVAKFCRVLDSVKAKFGILFCPKGHSGEGKATNADREILKVYQDRGIVLVVIDRDDLQRVAQGANFISLLRRKYETVRLDLQNLRT